MDKEILVEDISGLVQAVSMSKGPIALLLALALDERPDVWNLVVSAVGYDDMTIAEAIKHFSSLVRENIRKKGWRSIKRATVLRTGDPFVKAMNNTFEATNSVIELNSCSIHGIQIIRGTLFESRRLSA